MDLQRLYDKLTAGLAPLDTDHDFSRRLEIIGGTAMFRAPTVDMVDAVKQIDEAAQDAKTTVARIEIYADTLTTSGDIIVPPTCAFIAITARLAFVDIARNVNFRLEPAKAFGVRFVKDDHPHDLKFNFLFTNGKGVSQPLNLGPKILGNLILLDQHAQITFNPDISPLFANFDYLTAAERIMNNGELKQLGLNQANDNLPKLLSFQLLLASQNQDAYPDLNFEIAHFVSKVTASIPKALDYNSQASAITGSCVLGNKDVNGTYLSPLNITLARDVLTSRLAAASVFDQSYRDFATLSVTSSNLSTIAQATFQASQDAHNTYQLLADVAKGNYDSAQTAFRIAQSNFNDLQTKLPDVQAAFNDGIEAYKTKQIIGAVIEGLKALVLIGGSIAIAVVAPPAGAIVATGATAEIGAIVKAGADVTEKVSTIIKLINTLKDLFTKIKPVLEKIGGLVETIKRVVTLMITFKRIDGENPTDGGGLVLPVSIGDDRINMSADWDTFAADMDSMATSLVSEHIGGAREFFVLMQDMTIRAEALFAAQNALTIAGQAYCAALAQVALNEKTTQDWENAVNKLHESEENCKIFRLAMLDKLLRTRSWVLYDFRTYVSAYGFFALDNKLPITLDALRTMGDLQNDAATLQMKIAQAKSSIQAQEGHFKLTSEDKSAALLLSTDWKDTLQDSRMFVMTILPTSQIFSKRARIRIRQFSIFLDGVQVPENPGSIRLTINFARNLQDLSMHSPQELFAYIGAETRAEFEYASRTDIRMEGKLLYPEDAVAIPPFTTWTVNVDPYTDCSTITGLSVELSCEISML